MFEDYGYEDGTFEPEQTKEEWIAERSEHWKSVGKNFMELRQSHNITISELARQLGTSASTISRFEKGFPVTRSELLVKSYSHYFELLYLKSLITNEQSA